jgi:hypothetical protein
MIYSFRHDERPEELDRAFEMIVRADSEGRARELASAAHIDEGAEVWLDPARSTCEVIDPEGAECVLATISAGF